MCTAVSYFSNCHYFGRTLDLEYSYNETVTVTPRNFPFAFRYTEELKNHYAIIGMSFIKNGYPLYYDAVNEKGLCMAGLNFPGNAVYFGLTEEKLNITPFEFIPYILAKCKSVYEAKKELVNINLLDENFDAELPLSPLHWIIADKDNSITVESVKDGLRVYENPVGVLTNNPPFDVQMLNLANYRNLTSEVGESRFSQTVELSAYSKGMGAFGLPGDLSSASRFVRACFTKLNSVCKNDELSQFFHILSSVEQQRGCVRTKEGYVTTIYTSCCDADNGIYYYTTYNNKQISAVDMHRCELGSKELFSYPLITKEQIKMQN